MKDNLAAQAIKFLVNRPLVIHAAGGGAEAAADLQAQNGCSRILMEGGVPYARRAVRDHVGRELRTQTLADGSRFGGATSESAAQLLSWAAWSRAAELCSGDGAEAEALGTCIGVGVACTLSGKGSTRSHGDEAWVSVRTGVSGADVLVLHMAWAVGQQGQDRDEQSRAVSDLILKVLGGALASDLQGDGYSLVARELCTPEVPEVPVVPMFLGATSDWWVPADEAQLTQDRYYLLPGSFNPLTSAHVRVKIAMDKHLGKKGVFQISLAHFNKPPVPMSRVAQVAGALQGVADLVVAPDLRMALDKAAVLGLDMVFGADVITQVSEHDLRKIAARGRRIFVVKRPGYDLPRQTRVLLAELDFEVIPMELSMSSSAIRKIQGKST